MIVFSWLESTIDGSSKCFLDVLSSFWCKQFLSVVGWRFGRVERSSGININGNIRSLKVFQWLYFIPDNTNAWINKYISITQILKYGSLGDITTDTSVGKRVCARFFQHGIHGFYYGSVVSYNPEMRYYRVSYDDRDEADYTFDALERILLKGIYFLIILCIYCRTKICSMLC